MGLDVKGRTPTELFVCQLFYCAFLHPSVVDRLVTKWCRLEPVGVGVGGGQAITRSLLEKTTIC
jgi:hypothetical protein